MEVKNLPKLITVNKLHTCDIFGKDIKRGESAVYHWWIKSKKAYSHVKCTAKKPA